MNKVDKETLLDLHVAMMDLVKEARTILQLEAPKLVYERAKAAWLDHLEAALGHGKYEDAYNGTFWITLEELGILKMDGTVAELEDDPDEFPETDEMDGKPSINENTTTRLCLTIACGGHQRYHADCKDCNPTAKTTPSKEDDIKRLTTPNKENDNEGEDFVEAVYAVDEDQTGVERTDGSTLGVVGEPVRELMEEAPTKAPPPPPRQYEACSYHPYYHWSCPECNPHLATDKKFWEGQPIQEPGATPLPVMPDFSMLGDWYGIE